MTKLMLAAAISLILSVSSVEASIVSTHAAIDQAKSGVGMIAAKKSSKKESSKSKSKGKKK